MRRFRLLPVFFALLIVSPWSMAADFEACARIDDPLKRLTGTSKNPSPQA